jgi:hypothetical protein
MDAKKRLDMARRNAKNIKKKIENAEKTLKKLDTTPIQDESLLVKYRGNFSVPAVWIAQQGVRLKDLPFIPAEKVSDLDKYIIANTRLVDGGDLDTV